MMDFSKYKTVCIFDIAEVERAQKDKVYPVGCTLIALSATKGQVEYMPEAGTIDSRWAVIAPRIECDPQYIYYSINQSFPRFIHEWKTGINLQIDNLRHLYIALHPVEVQKEIVRRLDLVEKEQSKEEKEIEYWKSVKDNFLGRMFLTNLCLSAIILVSGEEVKGCRQQSGCRMNCMRH